MSSLPFPVHEYEKDVHLIRHEDKAILLVGTAHVSQESVDLVKTVIENEKPDCVCLELDDKRFQALTQKSNGRPWTLRPS